MRKILIVFAFLLAAALTLYLPLSSPEGIFNTPDENANYFFAKTFEERGQLRLEEQLEVQVDNALHPRGVNVIGGFLVPESFLGLPLLLGGVERVARWLTPRPLALTTYLTALFTLAALPCLYGLWRRWFEERTSRLAFLFVLVLPSFLYWAGRPFMHTIIFLDLLIVGWWLALRPPSKWSLLAGVALGGTLAMRTSEVIWVAAVTLLILVFAPKPLRRAPQVALGALLVLVPLLFLNQDLYGNFFHAGYSVSETNLIAQQGAVPQLSRASFMAQLFLPFGFHPLAAAGRFARYAFGGMWWYAVPMVLGIIVGVRGQRSGVGIGRKYLLVWCLISFYLILSYGSFAAEIFADPKHPLEPTIGAPYLRYWLPIFVFGAPVVAQFFVWFHSVILRLKAEGSPTNVGARIRVRFLTAFGITIILVVFSLRTVVWHGPESWLAVRENLLNFAEARERIVRTTGEKAVFFAPRWADRVVWPARRVAVDMEGKDVSEILRVLRSEGYPAFWWRGRGEIPLEKLLGDSLRLRRRFDIDPKGKIYEIAGI